MLPLVALVCASGVNLAFDDFGTGYASLSMLQRFRIDRVKIDRSFVNGLPHKGEDALIVRWILMLARALGLRVVAEGVEQQAFTWLHQHGCEEAQGYLYAPALDNGGTLQARLQTQQAEPLDGFDQGEREGISFEFNDRDFRRACRMIYARAGIHLADQARDGSTGRLPTPARTRDILVHRVPGPGRSRSS